MEPSRLKRAAELLRSHYGAPSSFGDPGRWNTLVNVILARPNRSAPYDVLRSPLSTAEAGREELADALAPVPRGRQKAPVLKALAQWWLGRFGESDEAAWEGDLGRLREELLRIRGVSLELADRLLLFVGGRAVYPIDRATARIAARHGWIGPEAEYDEWQAYFVQGLSAAGIDARHFSTWMTRLGREHCGPSPRCDACPLRPLLPPGGPYTPGD